MNRRVIATSIAGIIVAASVGTAIALPSKATAKSGAFSFVAVQLLNHDFANNHAVSADKELRSGKVIGTDTVWCVVPSRTKANCHVAASYKQGQIFGNFTESTKTGALSGKITGGDGKFTGAVGTITGTPISATKEKVSITYQTP
ncbi:MAG: hypothetical protein ACTHK4_00620 [Mycobacteriales bacterium]